MKLNYAHQTMNLSKHNKDKSEIRLYIVNKMCNMTYGCISHLLE